MSRRDVEATIEFECVGLCGEDDAPTYMVEGRFNAAGEFETIDEDDMVCPECGEDGEPTDKTISVADL